MRLMIRWLRGNPQVFVLALICLVLGLGAFIAVLAALAQSTGSNLSGEPSGLITLGHTCWAKGCRRV